jgi:hypothetical protein
MQSYNLTIANSSIGGNWEEQDENDYMRIEFKSDGGGLWLFERYSFDIESYEVNDS